MNLHYMLVHLLAISNLVSAEGALEDSTSPGYKAFEHIPRWFAVRVALAEDVTQAVQRGGTVTILYVIRSWRRGR